MDKAIHITSPIQSDNQLPLADFYESLKGNGFAITVTQIAQANRIIVQYANQVKNVNELAHYLAPIFVGNAEEQVIFQEVFDHFFKKEIPKKAAAVKPAPKNWKWLIALYAGIVLLIFTSILLFQRYAQNPLKPTDIELKLVEIRQPKNKLDNLVPFHVQTGERLALRLCIDSAGSNLRNFANRNIWINSEYNWGTGENSDTIGLYQYEWPGKYTIRATARVWYKGEVIKLQDFEQVVVVCNDKNNLRITKSPATDSVAVNTAIVLKAITDPLLPGANINWHIDNNPATFTGELLNTSFNTPGPHTVFCKANFGGRSEFCMVTERITVNVAYPKQDLPKDTAKAKPTENTNAPVAQTSADTQKYNPILKQLYYTTLALFTLLAIFFFARWEKERKNAMRIRQDVLDSYQQVTGPASDNNDTAPKPLPYKNKNHLGLPEPELKEIALQMRKRIGDTVEYLDTEKTIRQSIEMAGFFQPVYSNRTKQSEYLILIHDNHPDSQLAKLIDYLLDTLVKQNVLIEKYYYRNDMGKCYQHHSSGTVALGKLAEKYPTHTLLIFGDGANLLHPSEPVMDEAHLLLLERWQHKALITPLSYADWGRREKESLAACLPIFPIDLPGLQLLFELLNNHTAEPDFMARLRTKREQFYPSENLSLNDGKSLLHYCNGADWANRMERGRPVNVLFQWVAALAVCPKLEWQIILAMGKAILGRYGLTKELNFTNLLRLIRVDWINQGVCPNALRLELLQALTPENEVLARETMLALLQEIPQSELADDPTLLEAQAIQCITHEFSLYVHNPSYYASYRESSYLFEKLWREGKIKDQALVTYYKNDAGGWQTLLSQAENTEGGSKMVGIEEYFESEHQEASIMTKVYLYLGIISLAGVVFSFFSLLLLRIWEV